MRICLVYDCLYPYTVGGAERWYRNLALRLRDAGHEVTYLTLRQWDGELDDLQGIDVRVVGPRMALYTGDRRRTRAVAECGRSEERRVGKECRSRWSPYH